MSFDLYIPYKNESYFHRYLGRHLYRLKRGISSNYTFHDNFLHYFWQQLSLAYKILEDNDEIGTARIFYRGPWPKITSLLGQGDVIRKNPNGHGAGMIDWLPFEPEFNPYVDKLADYLLDHVPPDNNMTERITFVRRITNRKVQNETEVIEALKRFGLPVHVEEFLESDDKFLEYVNIIRKSTIVVMVHGAAMTNALFMKPGSHFIEINPYGFIFPPLTKTLQRRGITIHKIECLPNDYQTSGYLKYYVAETPYPSKPELRTEARNSMELRLLLRDQLNLVVPVDVLNDLLATILSNDSGGSMGALSGA